MTADTKCQYAELMMVLNTARFAVVGSLKDTGLEDDALIGPEVLKAVEPLHILECFLCRIATAKKEGV